MCVLFKNFKNCYTECMSVCSVYFVTKGALYLTYCNYIEIEFTLLVEKV